MNEAQVRQKVVSIAQNWMGLNEADGSHMEIINTYNGHTPLPRNYKMTKRDAWCAAFVSAVAIKAGLTDIIPPECSCARMIERLKAIGAYVEDDAYVPKPGDILFYDWQDGKDYASTDNRGAPDHVGYVETVASGTMTIMEGNYNDRAQRRTVRINGRYIRGFGVPKYASKADAAAPNTSGVLAVGCEVQFIGTRQYANSYEDAAGIAAKPCTATVSLIREGRAHPYHLTGSSVNGWVNASDVLDPNRKSVETVAREVLNGLWGNGHERISRLTAAGYNAVEVQAMVNTIANG